MKTKFLIAMVLCAMITSARKPDEKLKINGIPSFLRWEIMPESYHYMDATLMIKAGPKTNMFYTHDGRLKSSNIPKLLFEPDEDFRFSAKVRVKHHDLWDAGVLLVYANEGYWAKLCFENESPGNNRIVTVVNNETSDDAHSCFIEGESVYLRIVKKGPAIRFFYSDDGVAWKVVRYFSLKTKDPIRIGFASQAPKGEQCTSWFSEIEYVKSASSNEKR